MDEPLSLILDSAPIAFAVALFENVSPLLKIDYTTVQFTWLSEPEDLLQGLPHSIKEPLTSNRLVRIWARCQLSSQDIAPVKGRLTISREVDNYVVDLTPLEVALDSTQFASFLMEFCKSSAAIEQHIGTTMRVRVGISNSDPGDWNSSLASGDCARLDDIWGVYKMWMEGRV